MMHNGPHTAVLLHTSLTNRPGHQATRCTNGLTPKPDAVCCWHLECPQATASFDKQWKAAQEAPQGSFNNRLYTLAQYVLSRVDPTETFLKSIPRHPQSLLVNYPVSAWLTTSRQVASQSGTAQHTTPHHTTPHHITSHRFTAAAAAALVSCSLNVPFCQSPAWMNRIALHSGDACMYQNPLDK
jgi:hypothetical protein